MKYDVACGFFVRRDLKSYKKKKKNKEKKWLEIIKV